MERCGRCTNCDSCRTAPFLCWRCSCLPRTRSCPGALSVAHWHTHRHYLIHAHTHTHTGSHSNMFALALACAHTRTHNTRARAYMYIFSLSHACCLRRINVKWGCDRPRLSSSSTQGSILVAFRRPTIPLRAPARNGGAAGPRRGAAAVARRRAVPPGRRRPGCLLRQCRSLPC